MSDVVNPSRRAYRSPRREEQARETRRAVREAAHRQFLDKGYARTTIGAVAAEAGVSVETVYKAFGNKAGLAKAVVDVAIVGDDEAVPMLQRELVRRIEAEPDARRKLSVYGDHVAAVGSRTGPLLLVVRAAAATDPGAAQVWDQLQSERITGMTLFARHLAEGGHLRKGVSVNEARDVLWAHNSVELWDLLVGQRRWTNSRFGRWVGQQLAAAVL